MRLLWDNNIYLLTLHYLVSEVVKSKGEKRHRDEDYSGENPIRRAHTNTASIVPGLHTLLSHAKTKVHADHKKRALLHRLIPQWE
jgi:hypothetical protein